MCLNTLESKYSRHSYTFFFFGWEYSMDEYTYFKGANESTEMYIVYFYRICSWFFPENQIVSPINLIHFDIRIRILCSIEHGFRTNKLNSKEINELLRLPSPWTFKMYLRKMEMKSFINIYYGRLKYQLTNHFVRARHTSKTPNQNRINFTWFWPQLPMAEFAPIACIQ